MYYAQGLIEAMLQKKPPYCRLEKERKLQNPPTYGIPPVYLTQSQQAIAQNLGVD